MKLRDAGYKVLFKGQRRARYSHWCETCNREICPNEFYFTKVSIIMNEDGGRDIVQRKSCCKEIR